MFVGYRIPAKLDGLKKKIKEIENIKKTAYIGLVNGATYSDGTSVAYVGYLNEYGGHNPPRPFLHRTLVLNLNKWTGLYTNSLIRTGVNAGGVDMAFKTLGRAAVGDVQRTIADWPSNDPRPNKPATIRRKARRARGGKNLQPIDPNKVLFDTGTMKRNIGYEVRNE